jgi:hypothetical protein
MNHNFVLLLTWQKVLIVNSKKEYFNQLFPSICYRQIIHNLKLFLIWQKVEVKFPWQNSISLSQTLDFVESRKTFLERYSQIIIGASTSGTVIIYYAELLVI